MNKGKIKAALLSATKQEIKENVLLSSYTTLGIGGPASFYVKAASTEDISVLLQAANSLQLPRLILGDGTNLLVADTGFEGLVIRMAFSGLEISPDRRCVTVGASVKSAFLVEHLVSEGLAGMEFAAGLPGTIGGAIAGNAGCFGSTLGEQLIAATVVMPDGKKHIIDNPAWFEFNYRRSRLYESGAVITHATFSVKPGVKDHLRKVADSHLETRKTKHPSRTVKTAGSYFKNLPAPSLGERRMAAGALLDKVGARQMSVGDAAVFDKHANIVINKGSARAVDVLTLTDMMAKKVKETFDVTLEPEVRFIGQKAVDIERLI